LARDAGAVLHSGRVEFLDFHRDVPGGPIYLAVLVPILGDQAGGRPLGVLALRIDAATSLYPSIQRWPVPSRSSETLIVRRDGNYALYLNALRFRSDAALELRLPLTSTAVPAVQAVLGKEGVLAGTDYRGVPTVAAVRTVPGSPWFVVAKTDESEALAPLRQRLWTMILLVVALVAGAGATVGWLWRQRSARFFREQYDAADAMRASEAKFRAVFEHSTAGKSLTSPDGRLIEVNPAFGAMLGYSVEEMSTLNFATVTHPDDVAESRECIRSLLAGERTSHQMEKRYLHRTGSIVWAVVSTTLLRDEAGAPRFFATSILDITDRKRAEEALQASEAMLNETGSMARIGGWEHDLLTGQATWTRGLYEIFEIEPGSPVPGPGEHLNYYPPDDRAILMAAYQRAVETGESFDIELHCHTALGRIVWARVMGRPTIRDGKCTQMAGMFQDITERKLGEEALRASEARLNEIVRAVPFGAHLYELQADGRLVFTGYSPSADRILGIDHLPLVGKTLEEAFPGNVGTEIPDAYRRVAATGESWSNEQIAYNAGSIVGAFDVRAVSTGLGRMAAFFADITERRRSEEALRQSEARYRTLVENIPQKVFVKDRQSRFVSINENFARDLGIRPEDVVGKADSDLFPRELADKYRADDTRIMETGKGEELEERYLQEGRETWVQTRKTPLRNADGEIVGVCGVFADITARKLAEKALRSSEERFRVAAGSVADVVYEWDLKDTITWYGDVDGLTGYPPGAFPRTIAGWAATLHPDDLDPTWAAVQTHLKGETPYDIEYRVAAKDGGWRWWSARGTVLRDDRGEPTRWIGAVTDVTERKGAEEALRESERRFREMAESLPQLVWTCRGDGTCDYLSPQWVAYTGIPEAEQLGSRWLEQLHPDDHDPTVAAWNAAAGAGAIVDVEFRIRRHDGIYRWFRTRDVPLLDAAGRVAKWFGTSTDIEDLKRAEEVARQALVDLTRSNRELEQFAYVASHDLQEPLRMVSSYTQLLGQRYEGQLDEKAKKYIDYAVDGAVRMQRLINDLLSYSRVGTRGKAPESTDTHALLGEAIANLTAAIAESGAMVTNDDLPTVHADASQLGLVFQNLLANAIKFHGDAPPRVHVSARDAGREWVFTVRDNGIGIEPQFAERVFVIFQRLHTRQEYPGTGIGLALCKRIVERHGGRIWFESAPGTGTTFFFTVPK
jgi:PAS domain S-box-containing protein